MLYDGYQRQSRPDLSKNCKWTLRVQSFKDSFATTACIVSCLSYRDRQAHRIVFKPMPKFDKVVAKTSRSPLQCQPLREQNRSGDLGRPVLISKHACSPLRLHACRSSFTTVSTYNATAWSQKICKPWVTLLWVISLSFDCRFTSCACFTVLERMVKLMQSHEDHAYLSLL
jgi:hypothetical protein